MCWRFIILDKATNCDRSMGKSITVQGLEWMRQISKTLLLQSWSRWTLSEGPGSPLTDCHLGFFCWWGMRRINWSILMMVSAHHISTRNLRKFCTVVHEHTCVNTYNHTLNHMTTRNLGARWAPISSWWPSATLLALWACLTSSFTPFGHSSRVTHADDKFTSVLEQVRFFWILVAKASSSLYCEI